MRKVLPLIVGILLVAGFYHLASKSGPSDKTFRELDQLITSEYNQVKSDYMQIKITQQHYIIKLKLLSAKEKNLFDEVRRHKFNNVTEFNYWHRGRLKFPSKIKIELDLITKAEKDSL